MLKLNKNYGELKESYLFYNISLKTDEYRRKNPDKNLLHLGVGDVTLPLAPTVIRALHNAVDEQSNKETFHGYMPECGTEFLKKAVCDYYLKREVSLMPDEVFISSGASDELGNILDLFDSDNTVLIIEPAYPAYVDTNIIAGHRIIHMPSGSENDFTPLPNEGISADIIYICSPNNPTGAVYTREKLEAWVDYASKNHSLIIFDAAYEAFIEDDSIPHSIFEIKGSNTCAIEISSLSKTAGFTGMRCGYTVVPKTLFIEDQCVNDMWVRDRTTKSNGVSYIIQRGAEAVFSENGLEEIKKNIQYYKNNSSILMKTLDEIKIKYYGGKNAPYIWMQCPNKMSSWELFDYLLDNAQIIGTPGEGFGKCGEGYFRLSTFGDVGEVREAAKRIALLFGEGV